MTDHCYIAVKGSLHSTDSSVFGLTHEEIFALSKRFSDSCKEVINGVLIKGSPLQVINALGELGYRVTCSSGETEIVWTLRREVLVPNKLGYDEGLCMAPIPNKLLPFNTMGKTSLMPRNTLTEENGQTRRQYPTPTKRGPADEAPVQQSPPAQVVVKNVEKKKVQRLGTKPEDLAQYSNKDVCKIELKSLESLEDAEIPEDKRIIIKTNLSSEGNPLSTKYLEPHKPKDFETTYSGTIGKPPIPSKPQDKCDARAQPNSPRCQLQKQVDQINDIKPETVLAEYVNESTAAYVGSKRTEQFVPKTSMPQNIQRNGPNYQDHICQTTNKARTFPVQNIRNQNNVCQNMACRPNIPREKILPVQNAVMRNQPVVVKNTPRKVERIGTKPEDLAQYGRKSPNIDVLDPRTFVEMNPEEIIDRRIIVNTNSSSEENPLSARNQGTSK